MKSLQDICVAIVDCEHKTAPKAEWGYPSIRTTDIKNGRIDFENANRVSQETYEKWTKRRRPKPGDLILAREAPVGEVGYIPDGVLPVLGQRTVLISPDRSQVVPRYLHYLLLSPQLQHEIETRSAGSTVHHLNMKDIRALELPMLPSIQEQGDISSLLGALDDKIKLNRRMSATLEEMARALYRSWFVDFDPVHARALGQPPAHMDPNTAALFPDTFGPEGRPKGWEQFRFGDVAGLKNGFAFKSAHWRDIGVPVIKIGSVKPGLIEITGGSFIDNEVAKGKDQFRIQVGAAAIGLTGYVGEVGRIPPTLEPPLVNQRVARIDPCDGTTFSPFVYTVARSKEFKQFVIGKSYGSAQANVSTKDISAFSFLATPELIEAFNARTGDFFARQMQLIGESETLASLRDNLLPRLLSGELRIREAEKHVEEVV